MSSLAFYKQWKLALISSDTRKVDKLGSIIESTVSHFLDAPSFNNHLEATIDARECLILVAPHHSLRDLPPDIEEKLHELYIYGENTQNELQSFDDVCLHLTNLIVAQCTKQSIYYHCLKENGAARLFALESIARSKNLIQQLQDLCDDIDENISPGKEDNS